MPAYSEKLIIFCPPHFVTKWTAIADLFDVAGNLRLIASPGKYARIEEGEESKYYDYFNNTGVTLSPRRVGFNLTVSDQRFELRLALEELKALSLSTGYGSYVPITVHDYCRPEWQDYSQGYTIRVGKFEGFEDGNKGGGVQTQGSRQCDGTEVASSPSRVYGGGFRFRFLERNHRLVA